MSDPTPALGIPCRGCAGTFWVVTKTVAGADRIIRYRRCVGCGRVARTREVFEATPKARKARPGAPTT